MQVIRQGYRLIYVPQAVSHERVSLTATDEVIRRTRINAGRYQAIAMAGRVLPWKQPLLIWQICSHKFLRPLVPFFMIGAAISNLLLVIFHPFSNFPWVFASAVLLALQIIFYGMAWLGSRSSGRGGKGKLGKLLYLPAFLTNSNMAALQGLANFLRGGELHIWKRIQRG